MNSNLNCEMAEPATKSSWEKKPKIRSEIPILNGFQVEPNFLEGILSGVSYDDEIWFPFNRIPRESPGIREMYLSSLLFEP
jgi:hypothetical protein